MIAVISAQPPMTLAVGSEMIGQRELLSAPDGIAARGTTYGVRRMLVISFMEIPAPAAERVLGLDPESFRAFYGDALPRIYGYFLHRCGGSATVAEDLTQETFLAAVAELKKNKRVAAPTPWIYGIARHKLLDHYRRQERSERRVSAWEPERFEAELVVDDTREARELAIGALAAVAASQRAALVLCYVDGYSVPEAAELLGKSPRAVESLLARGRQAFKRAYLEESA
jgi:RNA polymerase sigma-70 factor (ECF subfamily)